MEKTYIHHEVMMCVINAMRILTLVDLPEAINRANRADSIGPTLDQTLWMKTGKKIQEDLEFMNSALPLWRQAARFEHPKPITEEKATP